MALPRESPGVLHEQAPRAGPLPTWRAHPPPTGIKRLNSSRPTAD